MSHGEVFIGESLSTVDAGRTRTISIQEVAALDHEIGDLNLISGALVLVYYCVPHLRSRVAVG